MKLCRYDDDRLGVVRRDLVHDVTAVQTEIRKSAPYAMAGDAVDRRAAAMARPARAPSRQGAGQTGSTSQLLSPVARPTKLTCAPTNYQAHIAEMAGGGGPARLADRLRTIGKNPRSRNVLKANSSLVGPSPASPSAFPTAATITRSNW